MHIYVDFDDILSETALHFSNLVKEMFGINVPYEEIKCFNLQQSFNLTDYQYLKLMEKAHTPEVLLSYKETPGASETLKKWIGKGNDVKIVTGRPYSSAEISRRWLKAHNLEGIEIIHVDKYGRQKIDFNSNNRALTVEEFLRLNFEFAVEDSPLALDHLAKMKDCQVAVLSRPWNVNCIPKNEKFIRCSTWHEIDLLFEKYCEIFFDKSSL